MNGPCRCGGNYDAVDEKNQNSQIDDQMNPNYVDDDDVDENEDEEVEDDRDADDLVEEEQQQQTSSSSSEEASPNAAATKASTASVVSSSGKTKSSNKKKKQELTDIINNNSFPISDSSSSSNKKNKNVDADEKEEKVGEEKKKISVDKDSLLALTYSVYAAVINLGSLIGFSAVPLLRNVGDIEFYTGTLAEDGKKKSGGFIYAWATCFGFALFALLIFISLAKFSKRFVRPKGFSSSLIHHTPVTTTHTTPAAAVEDAGRKSTATTTITTKGSTSGSEAAFRRLANRRKMKSLQHPVEYLANLAEAVGLSCLVNCCCSSFSTTASDDNVANDAGDLTFKNGDDEQEKLMMNAKKRHVNSLTGVLKIFAMLPIYWFTTQLTSSSFQVQAFCAVLPSWLSVDMLNTANTIAFLMFLPIFQVMTSKLLERLHKNGSLFFGMFQSVLVIRLFLGFIVAALAMLSAGFLQVQIDKVATLTEDGDCILKNQNAVAENVLPGAASISLPFILAGIASALCDPAALEAAFELAPSDMRSTVMSLYLLESSLSGFIGLGLTPFFSNPSTFAPSFFSMAVVLTVLGILWAFWVRSVHKQTAPAAVVAAAKNQPFCTCPSGECRCGEGCCGDKQQSEDDPNRALLADS